MHVRLVIYCYVCMNYYYYWYYH